MTFLLLLALILFSFGLYSFVTIFFFGSGTGVKPTHLAGAALGLPVLPFTFKAEFGSRGRAIPR